jgi:hypothetical protein
LQLDHVGLVTRDLVTLRSQWIRLGFAPTEIRELYRMDPVTGESISLGQRSCHAVFSRGYVELSQVMTPDAGHHLASWQARGPGLDILALSSSTLEADHARLTASALRPTPVSAAARRIDYGRLQGDARFRWCMLPPDITPEGLVCLMEHLTSHLVYQAEVQSHPNTAQSLEAMVVSVPPQELSIMVARYAEVLAQQPVIHADGGRSFVLEQGSLELIPQDRERGLSLPRLAGQAHFAALVVGVKDIASAERCLLAQDVPFVRQVVTEPSAPKAQGVPETQLWIDEADAGGARLIFRPVRV